VNTLDCALAATGTAVNAASVAAAMSILLMSILRKFWIIETTFSGMSWFRQSCTGPKPSCANVSLVNHFVFLPLCIGDEKGANARSSFPSNNAARMSNSTRDRLEQALERVADPNGEGSRAYLTVYSESARASADAADARARSGLSLGPLDGAIVSIKDLFDVAGEPTRAGSKVLAAEARYATADAPVVRRLRAAGAVIVGKTNMTEFAFSGIGINPHYGTPRNPADRSRIPGGSTSGGAVAVADGMCEIAIGSDTGGSTRIPAALTGIVGFKPSKYRVPTEGAFPLSFTLDSIGPMARSVRDCADADAILAGDEPQAIEPAPLSGLHFGVAKGLAIEQLDDTVARSFEQAIGVIGDAGARLTDQFFSLLKDMVQVNARGGFIAAEACAIHRDRLRRHGDDIDPIIRNRIERGQQIPAPDYIAMLRERSELVRAMDRQLQDFDALLMPTTPIVAPQFDEVAAVEGFMAKNMLLLRNTSVANFFDLCAISLPMCRDSSLPTGLMLVARNGQDHRLFRMAAAVESLLASER
jgi:aspartyl-tRNA(Asn)/glutamyl-tRNA(Gln) amidotransferase subunit A